MERQFPTSHRGRYTYLQRANNTTVFQELGHGSLKPWRARNKVQVLGSIPTPEALNSPRDSGASVQRLYFRKL